MATDLEHFEASRDEDSDGQYFDLDALSRAAEEVDKEPEEEQKEPVEELKGEVAPEEEVKEEEPPKPEEKPVEVEDNAERSRLGRRLAAIERETQREMSELKTIVMQQNQLLAHLLQGAQTHQVQPEPEDDFIPTTRRELDAYIAQKVNQVRQQEEQGQTQAQQKYEQGYVSTLRKYAELEDDDALYNTVIQEVTRKDSPFNVRHTDNPMADARINYNEAKIAILNQRLKTPVVRENPLKGKPPLTPLGAGSGSKPPTREVSLPKLSNEALSVARYFKLKDDEIVSVLKRK